MPKIKDMLYLMRLDKPVGIFLLLWPTLWGLWLASAGRPSGLNVLIFILGVILMRSAGCVINDIADRDIDRHIQRTRLRPLTAKKISLTEALMLFLSLSFLACLLLLWLNTFTKQLAVVGAILAVGYPFLKRITHLPQLGLGMAFAWGIPMAFAAEINAVPAPAWELFFAGVLWPVIYDTMYAMVDKRDDLRVGVKSTAILWGSKTNYILAVLQICFLVILIHIGYQFQLSSYYYVSLFVALLLFGYQLYLIKDQQQTQCFQAFLNNQWVGAVIFLGIWMGSQ